MIHTSIKYVSMWLNIHSLKLIVNLATTEISVTVICISLWQYKLVVNTFLSYHDSKVTYDDVDQYGEKWPMITR